MKPAPNHIRETLMFFVLILGISFAVGLPIAAASHGLLPITLPETLHLLVIVSPAVVALLLTSLKRDRLRRLLKPLMAWRVPAVWYLVALFTPLVINLAALGVSAAFGRAWPQIPGPLPEDFQVGIEAPVMLALAITLFFLVSSLGEELGWRGFALPRLQTRYTALVSSLIIGLVWAVWHLPLSLTHGTAQAQIPFGWYLPSTLSVAGIFTWIYNNTRGSLIPVILLHASVQVTNIFVPILPLGTGDTLPYILSVLFTVLLAAVLVLVYGHEDLSRAQGRMNTAEVQRSGHFGS